MDFSAELGGQVQVTDTGGDQTVQDAAVLHLTEESLFVEPLKWPGYAGPMMTYCPCKIAAIRTEEVNR